MSQIELKNLRKEFGSLVAVNNLNLTIEDGEFIVFVGPSGCGKTTTLRMIAGFEDPTSGDITIDGKVVNELEPRDRDLGMVFQSHALFPHKNVADNIAFGLRMKKVKQDEQARKVKEVSELVRITHLLGKMPGQCSGGESQRIALARTLVTEPSNFLLDEPLSSLDAKLRRELRAECDRLHDELQKTFIYVTHDQEEAMTLADRIVVMNQGKIVQMGSPLEIYGDPVSYFVADFFGNPAMNLVEGEFVSGDSGLQFKSPQFTIPLPSKYSQKQPGKGTLGIRPENVTIGATDAAASINREVELVEPLGKDTLLYFETGAERPFVAVIEGTQSVERHANVDVGFPDDAIFLFDETGARIR
ncbi:MAG: sugar ABC transporter ATP-binding protein [Alphaproteobacteria bacterium]|nr:sugar ABC transporter ATP-binding protein [Alphaproteobacteria bacterium]HCP00727.1 sugar ABC transporter ATP-binding protein [Rhodospirillaceae bacterium]